MANGERDVYKELAWDDFFAYGRMTYAAHKANRHLQASWRQPCNHDKNLERMALWHTVLLDQECAEALEPSHELRLWPPDISVQMRYGLQASIRMVHTTLPFTVPEREALREGPLQTFLDHYPEVESDELAAHEPELVDRWHQWLWLDELGRPQRCVAALGASAILAEGCMQLATSIDTILADPSSHPL